jgi:nucleoid DNA-binding protein
MKKKSPQARWGGKNMNKTELINTLAFDMGLTHQESRDILNYIFKLMADSLAAGEPVSITDFCSFRIKSLLAQCCY